MFCELARDVLARGAGEVGMSARMELAATRPVTSDDFISYPYPIEYPDQVMREKIKFVTPPPRRPITIKDDQSRAGRLVSDVVMAAMLVDAGYRWTAP